MTKQRPDASGMLLLLEFSDEDAQLVPKGHIFTMDLGHCMAFNGIGNLMEKLSRIMICGKVQETAVHIKVFTR